MPIDRKDISYLINEYSINVLYHCSYGSATKQWNDIKFLKINSKQNTHKFISFPLSFQDCADKSANQ